MFIFFSNDTLITKTYQDLWAREDVLFPVSKSDALAQAKQVQIAVIDEDVSLANQMAADNLSLAVILLTDAPNDKADADLTVLKKPIALTTLKEKINFLELLAKKGLSLAFETPDFIFDGATRLMRIKKKKQDVRLTEKEAEIIQYLHENKTRVVAKDELLEQIFGYHTCAETHTVETHIYKLRQKLSDEDEKLIATAEGGYRLIVSL